MKNRDEFLQSVWEKSEKALAEEKRQKIRQRKMGGFAAAAACLMLVAGVAGAGGMQGLTEDIFGGASTDEAMFVENQEVINGAIEATTSDDFAVGSTTYGTPADDADGAEKFQVTFDGASPGMAALSNAELYDVLREETEYAEKRKESDFMGYFCLPIGVVIEDSTGSVIVDTDTGNGDEEKLLLMYMQWFYSIPEEQVLTTEEFQSLKEIPTGYYKFTMDQSLGADTEGADRVFWITGEVSLP